MALLLANNAVSRLAAGLTPGSTNIALAAGDGAKFPSLAPGSGDWYPLTLVKADGTFEIVRAVVRSGDTINVSRAQEGTSAQTFAAGDRVELRLTVAALMTLFGGTNATPTFGGIELVGPTPFVDFRYGSTADDYSYRIIADGAESLRFASKSNPATMSLTPTALTVSGGGIFGQDVQGNNVIARGGILEVGTVGTGSTQIKNDASLSYRPPNGSYGPFGSIWTAQNFLPAGKVSGDGISTAGFAAGDAASPYFRRASDGALTYLQTNLGYVPVRTSGTNAVYMGWDGSRMVIRVDNTFLGALVTGGTLASDLSNLGVGSIGSYAMLYTAVAATPGTIVQSQNLLYANTSRGGASIPPGSWRSMGDAGAGAITLFLRTS